MSLPSSTMRFAEETFRRQNQFPLQYADYAVWQRRCLTDDWLSTQSDYWQKKLAGLSKLSLPTDYPRPVVQTFTGSHRMLELPTSLIERLKQFSANTMRRCS